MRKIVFIVLIFGLFSCTEKQEDKTEEIEARIFRLDNIGWKSKKLNRYINSINYTATEVPLQYYIMNSIGSEDLIKVDSVFKSHKKERVLEIEFQHDEQKDLLLSEFTKKSYQDGVKYLAFDIQNDFKVVTSSQDTINCSGVQFERNFKVAPFKRALLYFGGINPDDQIQLIYNDQLFGNGLIKFKFKETPIKL